jgi:RNA polymerase II subunit A small phosphatase-like protein
MDKQLLILDLDETLVHGAETPLERKPDFLIGLYSVYRRPFLGEFLAQVYEWFRVAVWSSATRPYVQGVVEEVFAGPRELVFVWSRERCTQCLDPEFQEYYWVKNLKKVKRLGHALERVLVVDDSARKLERQYGNHLRVRPFFGEPSDTELRDVLPFLNRLRDVDNLRTVEKRFWRRWANEAGPA